MTLSQIIPLCDGSDELIEIVYDYACALHCLQYHYEFTTKLLRYYCFGFASVAGGWTSRPKSDWEASIDSGFMS